MLHLFVFKYFRFKVKWRSSVPTVIIHHPCSVIDCSICGQSYKHFTLVNYDSRVVIYERKMFIILATGFTAEAPPPTYPTPPSVTRFGEISPLWQNVKSLWSFRKVHLVLGKFSNLLWQFLTALGKFSLLEMA